MDIEALRHYCLQFPHATENVQWGCDLCFKVDGKLFLVTPLEPAPVRLSFKCSAENFAELCDGPEFVPRPTWRARSGSAWNSSARCPTRNCTI